jgi:hypothetical protein
MEIHDWYVISTYIINIYIHTHTHTHTLSLSLSLSHTQTYLCFKCLWVRHVASSAKVISLASKVIEVVDLVVKALQEVSHVRTLGLELAIITGYGSLVVEF